MLTTGIICFNNNIIWYTYVIGDKYMEDKIIDTIKDIGNKLNEEYLRAGTKSKRRRILYELFALKYYVKKNLV